MNDQFAPKTPGEMLFETFNVEQAKLLQPEASICGLKITIELHKDNAAWLIEQIINRRYESPERAINAVMAHLRTGHHDLAQMPPDFRTVQIANSTNQEDSAMALYDWLGTRLKLRHGQPDNVKIPTWQNANIREDTSE